MGGSLVKFLLLGILITILTSQPTASRNTRQAGRCSAGQQCIHLSSCPEVLALLNPPTPEGIRCLQGLTCDFDRRNPKVCCDVSAVEEDVSEAEELNAPAIVNTTVEPTPDPFTPVPGTSHLLPEQCGSGIGLHIYGGDELPMQSYPWMALIGYNRKSNPDWRCGGSLISHRYVVTAAHCNDKHHTRGETIVTVRLGEHDIREERDCEHFNTGKKCAPPVQEFNPENIIMHHSWDKRSNLSDDIALIRLDRPVEFNGYVQPICLPTPGMDVSAFLKGRKAEVAGWGQTERNIHSNVKLMVKLPFVALEKCKPPIKDVPLLEKGQICFGGEMGKDSCIGDSGGPLVSTDLNANSSKLYVLLGVVSYGPPLKYCGNENRPGVYTDVAQYTNWIVSNLRP